MTMHSNGAVERVSAGAITLLLAIRLAASASPSSAAQTPLAQVQIVGNTVGTPIPSRFDGLSTDYPALAAYLGPSPQAPNRIFRRLLLNLGSGVLRVGGDTQDTSCWDSVSPGNRWCAYRFGTSLAASLFAGMRAANWQVIVGLNLAVNDPPAATRFVQAAVVPLTSRGTLAGLEIGNEPDLYPRQGIRGARYSFGQYVGEFNAYAKVLRRHISRHLPLLGPAWFTTTWDPDFGTFLRAAAPLAMATIHYYPFSVCGAGNAARATIPHLLAPTTVQDMVRTVEPLVQVAGWQRVPLRLDEMNSVSCHGKRGVSNSFAAALWALHSMFALAQIGVSGVNFHMYAPYGWPGFYNPIVSHISQQGSSHPTYVTAVRPIYYGLLLFRYAVGHRLVPVRLETKANIAAYAVRAGSQRRLFLLNMTERTGAVVVTAGGSNNTAWILTLHAPSLAATRGITFGNTAIQISRGVLPPLHQTEVRATQGAYHVVLPAASALMVTIPTRP